VAARRLFFSSSFPPCYGSLAHVDAEWPATLDPVRSQQPPAPGQPALICSAKGCRQVATWTLRWNNPKLHPPERRKTWLACDEHRASLGDFLAARGFLREVEAAPTLEG
jgi:hypothetical protein